MGVAIYQLQGFGAIGEELLLVIKLRLLTLALGTRKVPGASCMPIIERTSWAKAAFHFLVFFVCGRYFEQAGGIEAGKNSGMA